MFSDWRAPSVRLPYWRQLRSKILIRLECLLGQVAIELVKLRRMGDITFVSRFGTFGLHLERFVRRLSRKELFNCLAALFE